MTYSVYLDGQLIYKTGLDSLRIFKAELNMEVNKAGTFKWTMYEDHPLYDWPYLYLKSTVKVYRDDKLIFYGRVLDDSKDFKNAKTITCEGELAFLVDSIQRPYDFYTGDKYTTPEDLFKYFIEKHNEQVDDWKKFNVGEVTVTYGDTSNTDNHIVRGSREYNDTLTNINEKLIESLGGYLFIRHEAGEIHPYIDWLAEFPHDYGQGITYGENLLDITTKIDAMDVATRIVPLGASVDSMSDGTDIKLTMEGYGDNYPPCTKEGWNGKDYIQASDEFVEEFGLITKVVEFEEVHSADTLYDRAKEYLDRSILINNNIELSAIDLATINRDVSSFDIGEYISVYSKVHGIERVDIPVTKVKIDILNPANNKLTLNKSWYSLTEQSMRGGKISIINNPTAIKNQTDRNTTDINKTKNNLAELENNVVPELNKLKYTIFSSNYVCPAPGVCEGEFKFNDVSGLAPGQTTLLKANIYAAPGDLLDGTSVANISIKLPPIAGGLFLAFSTEIFAHNDHYRMHPTDSQEYTELTHLEIPIRLLSTSLVIYFIRLA